MRREDGSVLVIDYDQFNKLISQRSYENGEYSENDIDWSSLLSSRANNLESFELLVDNLNQHETMLGGHNRSAEELTRQVSILSDIEAIPEGQSIQAVNGAESIRHDQSHA